MSDEDDKKPTLELNPEKFDDVELGNPDAYYQELVSKPLPDEILKYLCKKFKLSSKEEIIDFIASPAFIDEIGQYDYLLFFEQVLGNTVKPFHKLFAKQVYAHRSTTLAPRGVGKSHFFSVSLPLWISYYEKAKKIMIISETDDQAKRILDEVKKHIEENPILREKLYIKPTAKESVWNKNKVVTKNNIEITARSFTSKMRGFHPHVLILDDVLSNENSLTKMAREQVFNHYAQTIRPMATKKAMIQFVGTAQHKDDLLHKLGASKSFKFLKLRAFDDNTNESIWPEQLPPEELEDYKKTYGIVSFEKEFQNNPMSDNLSLFPMYVLEKCLDPNLSYESGYYGGMRVYLGADFSMAGVKDGDFTVITAARVDQNQNLYLLNYDRFRDDPDNPEMFVDKQISSVARYCKDYSVTRGYLESNAFQRIYSEYFRKKTNLPLSGNNVSRSGKNSLLSGIPGIRVLMENGKVKLPYKTEEDRQRTEQIIREFNGLVMHENGRISNQQGNDDIPMSFFHMIQAMKEYTTSVVFRPSSGLLKGSRAHSFIGKGFKRRK